MTKEECIQQIVDKLNKFNNIKNLIYLDMLIEKILKEKQEIE